MVTCLLTEKKPITLKHNNNTKFLIQFCLGSLYNKFKYLDSEEVSFKRNIYDFSVDSDVVDKSEIIDMHNYLMVQNNNNKCLD